MRHKSKQPNIMKTMIPLVMLLLSHAANSFAQGNLQFNQVINISPGQTYTVPDGKVFKVESVPVNDASVATNFMAQNGCGGVYTNANCSYATEVFLTINNVQIRGTGVMYVACCGCCTPTRNGPANIPPLNFPIWLNAGKVISVGSNVSGVFVSGIEFNVIP